MAQIHEKLVEEWYRRQGYFTIRGAKAKGSGNNEIDLLAQKINSDGTISYRHIECQISFRPIGYIGTKNIKSARERTKEEIEEEASMWVKNKFLSPNAQNIRKSFVNNEVNWIYTFVHHIVKESYELEVIKNHGIELVPFKIIKNSLDPQGDKSSDARDEVELLRDDEVDQLKTWRLFIKSTNEEDAYPLYKSMDTLNFQISNKELTLKEVPNLENCHELHISQFALTYNAYNDKELYDKYHKIYDEYFEEGKHKNSLQHLRALLFFLQRQEHFSGPSENYIPFSKKIISDIIKILK